MWRSGIALGILVLAPGAAAATPSGCVEANDHAQVEIAIEYGEGGAVDRITASPDEVTIHLDPARGPTKVCWSVGSVARGHGVRIAGKPIEGQTSPFPAGSFLLSGAARSVSSGKPSRTGRWEYLVEVREGGKSLGTLDPVVIIGGGGGDGDYGGGGD